MNDTTVNWALFAGVPEWDAEYVDKENANARLIAAAPDLLEACQLFAAYEKSNLTNDGLATMVAYSLARKAIHAALAKATGEAA